MIKKQSTNTLLTSAPACPASPRSPKSPRAPCHEHTTHQPNNDIYWEFCLQVTGIEKLGFQ